MIEERMFKIIAGLLIMACALASLALSACNFDNFMSAMSRFAYTQTDKSGVILTVDANDWSLAGRTGQSSDHVLRDRSEKITAAIGPAFPNPVMLGDTVTVPFENMSRYEIEVSVYGASGKVVTLHQGEEYWWSRHHHLKWNLRDSAGSLIAPGIYTIVMKEYGRRIATGDVLVKL